MSREGKMGSIRKLRRLAEKCLEDGDTSGAEHFMRKIARLEKKMGQKREGKWK